MDRGGDNLGKAQGHKGSRKFKIYGVLQKSIGNGLAAFWPRTEYRGLSHYLERTIYAETNENQL